MDVINEENTAAANCCGAAVSKEDGNGSDGRLSYIKQTQVAALFRSPGFSPGRSRTFEIEIKNLCYKIMLKKDVVSKFCRKKEHPIEGSSRSRYILKNVSCKAKPGEILAIAGPSGAGKSTLLELLAGRMNPTSSPGCIQVNGEAMDMAHFRRISGYVMQHDALFPMLTVYEALLFSAALRLPWYMPRAEKRARVEALLQELGLSHVADSRIGSDKVRGVSGGERRRVSIGVDVVHDPAVLLLDEPTSGLDSAGALHVVGMLRVMAESHGRTIILSIHQPGFRILEHIHSILLLANGSVVHYGSVAELASRLAEAGHQIPQQVNVLEYAIDTIDLLEAEKSCALSGNRVAFSGVTLQDLFVLSGQLIGDLEKGTDAVSSEADSELSSDEPKPGIQCKESKPNFANSRMQEVSILTRRFAKVMVRTRHLFFARAMQAILAGLGLGSLFLKLKHTPEGVQERFGFFAFTLTFLLSSTTEALPLFLQERQILIRETSRGAYRISSYVISNTLVFLPFLLICSLMYSAPTYWMVGLAPFLPNFLFFSMVVWLTVVMANSFVSFFSSLVPNYIMGYSMISATMGTFFLFSGYFISKDSIPKYWIFMHYLSLFKYPLDALLINEYSLEASPCFGPILGGVCTLSGRDVLRRLGLDTSRKWSNVGMMLIFCLVYRLLCYLVLRIKLAHSKHR